MEFYNFTYKFLIIIKECLTWKYPTAPPGADAIKKVTPSLGIPSLGV